MKDQSARARAVRRLDRVGFSIDRVSGAVSVMAFATMLMVVLLGVFFRYVMEDPFQWTEELARFLMLWGAFLAMNLAMRSEEHIRIDFIVKTMPRAVQSVVGILVDLLAGCFLVYLTIKGIQTTSGAIMTALSMDFSMAWIYASVPVGAFLTLVQLVLNRAKKMLSGFEPA
ncbi:MAG: TRAP transporter small permease [Proteobacteria bacterium]|nr:TRAP transporter small permease [Pseudomonadota bacterium]